MSIKFKDMPYKRPDIEEVKTELEKYTKELREAKTYEEAKAIFLREYEYEKHFATMMELANIRHSIDTRDEFYDGEENFWNNTMPVVKEYMQNWTIALLESPFRKEFEEDYGDIIFINAEIDKKAFSPKIIEKSQKENELITEYMKLIASAQIEFEGKKYTLSQFTPFKNSVDDNVRLAAWKAEGAWYKEKQGELDRIYDELVSLRDSMGKDMGYEGFTELGYYRMGRNCYTKEDVEKFREAVRNHLVPVATQIFKMQAERTGVAYPMSYSDVALQFRSGNSKPKGTAEDILAAGKKFYEELSPITAEFFNKMLDMEMMDVLSTEGKEAGGYCTSVADYDMPFIFANFNGTQGDVEVVTHEAGHAFAAYLNAKRIPLETIWPGMESCEVHSMSMEYFAWPWAEDFFGDDARKFRFSHLASSIGFIPYGTLVDHFQHEVYEHPEMSPKERHAKWKELQGIYMPWIRLDGEIPFFSEGEAWQRQQHIYNHPFYYIDYCLAQTVALLFWAKILDDKDKAWEQYMAYTKQGGSTTFVNLLKNAGLKTPFDEEVLKEVSGKAKEWIESYDLTGIE